MVYRIKYLLGIMAALFGLLYLLIGIVGWSESATVADRWMPLRSGACTSVWRRSCFGQAAASGNSRTHGWNAYSAFYCVSRHQSAHGSLPNLREFPQAKQKSSSDGQAVGGRILSQQEKAMLFASGHGTA